ncbi:unnamed protein product [Rotaria sordida]|uniref:WSC domain-containing protein n=1 Tax=Rotaria sordida TaxID=392033 RepID=A0A819FU49_9BILA|nr:unnamed protein product [Rotaria sordida]
MEPTLCFILCETPVIYLQGTICRCSSVGLTDHNRLTDDHCTIPCIKPGNHRIKTINTCGGRKKYSAYAEENYYIQYADLLNFRIQLKSCELWNTSDYYDTVQVKINESSFQTKLTTLERCAFVCLKHNARTKSIAFNGDNNQCLCIISQRLNLDSDDTHHLTILSNNSCDRYCDNIFINSKIQQKFICGSLKDSRIWTIYNLNAICPIGSIYIKEFEKCILKYKGISNSCPSPSMNYIYNGNPTWNIFLKSIRKLNITKSILSIDFTDNITINSLWLCSTNNNTINSNIVNKNYNTSYILDNGCLRIHSTSSNSHILSTRLCMTNRLNNSLFNDNRSYSIDVSVLDENVSIQEVMDTCIIESTLEKNSSTFTMMSIDTNYTVVNLDDKNKTIIKHKNPLIDTLEDEIAQYMLPWEVRLGFFLLDTNVYKIESELSLSSNTDLNRSSINEFQIIISIKNNNSTMNDKLCLVVTRATTNEQQRISISIANQSNNCSQLRHVLCRKRSIIIDQRNQQICFRKPLTLDVPVIISNYLTHELCMSTCMDLVAHYEQRYALLNSNTCLCMNNTITTTNKLTFFNCDRKCYGNYFYRCGHTNDSTIYSVYLMRPVCPLGFQMTDKQQRCAHVTYLVKDSFSSAQSYCKSRGGVLAKINDILEIQDLLPNGLLNNNNYYFDRFPFDYSIINKKEYFWIDRTTNIINNNTTSQGFLRNCIERSKSIDRNCIVLRREKIFVDNVLQLQRCLSESDQCSSASATPVCVDKNLESHLNTMPSMIVDDLSTVKVNMFLDNSCGNDTDYHLIDIFCYKVLLHKMTWHEGKAECERDNATLFLPTINGMYRSVTKFIPHQHNNISSTSIIHTDFSYVNETSYIKWRKSIDESIKTHKPDYEYYHTLCKESYHDNIFNLIELLSNLTMKDIDELEVLTTKCTHIKLGSNFSVGSECNEKSCNQSATVICQKLPIITARTVLAKRLVC